MYRVKDAFKALKKRWVVSLLLLIQFTYGLSTITGTSNIFYNLYSMNFNSILDLNSTFLVVPDGNVTSTGNTTKEQVEGIYNKLKDHKDVISFGTYSEATVILDTKARPLDSELVEAFTRSPKTSGLREPYINGIVIDENYNRLLDLKVSKGQGFSAQDFNKNSNEETNVLAGSFFKKFYKLGDLINNQYRIIGFLPDKYIVNANMSNTYLKLDKAIIIPMSKDRYNNADSMLMRLQFNTVLKLRSGADLEQLTQIVQLQGNSPLKLENLGDTVRKTIKENAYLEIPQLVLGLSFVLFSVIGIVVTTMVSILIRRREFGIKLAFGESTIGVFSQITYENLMIGIAGLGLSLLHFTWKYKDLLQVSSEINMANPLDFKLNGSILVIVFFIFMCIISIASFFIYLFIRKQEPKSLIGGME